MQTMITVRRQSIYTKDGLQRLLVTKKLEKAESMSLELMISDLLSFAAGHSRSKAHVLGIYSHSIYSQCNKTRRDVTAVVRVACASRAAAN
jgi:hypothetical protein